MNISNEVMGIAALLGLLIEHPVVSDNPVVQGAVSAIIDRVIQVSNAIDGNDYSELCAEN